MGHQLDFADLLQRRAGPGLVGALDGKRGRSFAAKRAADLNRHGDAVLAGARCTWEGCPVHTGESCPPRSDTWTFHAR
jgi:hypothetical protein